MTKEKQIIALAELDGWANIRVEDEAWADIQNNWHSAVVGSKNGFRTMPPDYLNSYDAIMPIAIRILGEVKITSETTPEKICEMVLYKVDNKAV